MRSPLEETISFFFFSLRQGLTIRVFYLCLILDSVFMPSICLLFRWLLVCVSRFGAPSLLNFVFFQDEFASLLKKKKTSAPWFCTLVWQPIRLITARAPSEIMPIDESARAV